MAAGTYSNANKTDLGAFTLADDDVAKNVAAAASDTSPVVRAARQSGIDYANSRGLLNTSLAAGNAEAEAYKVAVPIGTAQAQIGAQKNISNQTFEQNTDLTKTQGSEQRLGTVTQGEQQRLTSAQGYTQQKDLDSQAQGASKDIANINNASNERINGLDQATKIQLQTMDTDSRERIAAMNVKANQQDKAISAALTSSNIYASMANAIASNSNIPADARNSLMENTRNLWSSNVGLVEQLYNIDLNYGSPIATPTASYGGGTTGGASGGASGGWDLGGGSGGGVQYQPDGGYIDAAGNRYDSNNVYMGGGYDASTGGADQGYYGFNGRDPNNPYDTN